MDNNLRERVRRTVLARLESARHAGVQQIVKAAPAKSVSPNPKTPTPNPSSATADLRPNDGRGGSGTDMPNDLAQSSGSVGSGEPRRFADPDASSTKNMSTATTLEVLQEEAAACTRCDELAKARTQTVFGVGNPNARLCFLGEAPGADEDRLGEPFVGRAGKLLNDMIQKGMKLERSDVYILNVLKCRPPANRNPTPNEAANCRPFLLRQLDLIEPEFICCLGAVAAQNLLATTSPIGRLRGSVHDWRGIRVVCTYHPAYLLRNPSAKARTWEDIQLLMREMGI